MINRFLKRRISLLDSPPSFTIEVKSDNAGTSGTNQFTIPTTTGTYLYDYTTSDGQSGTGITGDETITFDSGVGTYEIYITGTFPKIYFNNTGDRQKLLRVLEWGDYGVGALDQQKAFCGCSNLTSIADDCDNLNLITNGVLMFANAGLTTLPNTLTLASLTNGYSMFQNSTSLEDTGVLTLENLITGSSMFSGCTSLLTLSSGMILPNLTAGDQMFENCIMVVLPSVMTCASLLNGYNMFFSCELTSLPSGMTLPVLTHGYTMFSGNNDKLKDLPAGMTLPALTNGTNMFSQCRINTYRYSQLLVDMQNTNPNNSVPFDGGLSKYNIAGERDRNLLTGVGRTWTITDGGKDAVGQDVTAVYTLKQPFTGAGVLAAATSWDKEVIEVRRSSDNAVTDVFFDGSGNISLTSLVSAGGTLGTWVGANDGLISKWYGLTPDNKVHTNKTATQVSTTGQPQFIIGGVINTKGGNATLDMTSGFLFLEAPANIDMDADKSFMILHISWAHNLNTNSTVWSTIASSSPNTQRLIAQQDLTSNKDVHFMSSSGGTFRTKYLAQENNVDPRLNTLNIDGSDMKSYFNGTLQQTVAFTGTYRNDEFRIGVQYDSVGFHNGGTQMIMIIQGDQILNEAAIQTFINSLYTVY